MREIRTSGLMSGEGKRDGHCGQHPRPSSTLPPVSQRSGSLLLMLTGPLPKLPGWLKAGQHFPNLLHSAFGLPRRL